MAPFLPLLPAGQEGHPASHTSRTLEESHPQTGGTSCARARLLRLGPMDTGAAQQHRGQAGRGWEHVGGSESAAAPPIPAALLEGTRVKVTGHPLSPDGRPPPLVLHRHSPREGRAGSACAAASGVCGGTCLSPPRGGKVGGTEGMALQQYSGATTNGPHPVGPEPSASRLLAPAACSLHEQSKVGRVSRGGT